MNKLIIFLACALIISCVGSLFLGAALFGEHYEIKITEKKPHAAVILSKPIIQTSEIIYTQKSIEDWNRQQALDRANLLINTR